MVCRHAYRRLLLLFSLTLLGFWGSYFSQLTTSSWVFYAHGITRLVVSCPDRSQVPVDRALATIPETAVIFGGLLLASTTDYRDWTGLSAALRPSADGIGRGRTPSVTRTPGDEPRSAR